MVDFAATAEDANWMSMIVNRARIGEKKVDFLLKELYSTTNKEQSFEEFVKMMDDKFEEQ